MRASARRRLRNAFVMAVIASMVPASISGRGIASAEIECQSGTCCEELKSLCIIGSWTLPHKYAKSEGSCTAVRPVTPG
jgi:hypothetical protein